MKIAVTGKGGVGKTTFAATLARLYAEEEMCIRDSLFPLQGQPAHSE